MKFIFVLCAVFTSAAALAGGATSGGGGAMVCRDQNKKIISAQLLDLYEGSVRYGYSIPKTAKDPNQALQAAISRLSTDVFAQARLTQFAADIVQRFQFLPNGAGLNAPPRSW